MYSRHHLGQDVFGFQKDFSRPLLMQDPSLEMHPIFRSLFTIGLFFLNLHDGIIQNIFFSVWLILLRVMSVTILHIVACLLFFFPPISV